MKIIKQKENTMDHCLMVLLFRFSTGIMYLVERFFVTKKKKKRERERETINKITMNISEKFIIGRSKLSPQGWGCFFSEML